MAMASIATKARKPRLLAWRSLRFGTACGGRLGLASFSSSSPSSSSLSDPELEPPPTPPAAGTKVLESFREEFEIGSRLITLETGKIARFANGAVVLGMEDTKVLSTVASSKGDAVASFLPLTVDYQEKQFAQGLIPKTYTRREGAPKERELLVGRLIDRPIRPLFPAGFFHEVQVMASVLSSDGKHDPDVMAANATSAALMLSDIPWGGPVGMIRIGRICGEFIINPTTDELSLSDLNLVYACTKDKTLMIDVQAQEISERDLEAGLRLAHPEAVKYLEPQMRLAAKAGKTKKEYKLSMVSDRTLEKVHKLAEAPIEAVFTDPSYGKFERGEALDNITRVVKRALEEEGDEESLLVSSRAVDMVRKKIVRKKIMAEGLRVDGRRLDEVRPLYCEAGYLRMLQGSSLFSRGDTQVLCTVTIGAPGDAQKLDSIVGPPRKRFMLHYTFPPFSINEVGKRVGLNRREVGHGTLAEKALLAVLPPEDFFPYTVRVNSEVMASDGSTSMATVCGGSMALMDAGIPLREHVAGVSVGLVSEVDPVTGEVTDYRILTDILGLEDHLGDMDFKIAGTRKGVTAIQLDIKPAGIPLDIICECLEPAHKGRLQILGHMEREISLPRTQDDRDTPQLATLKFSNDALRRLIGPLGVLKRRIEEETGARLSVSDGTLTIVAKNPTVMEKVQEKIEFTVGREMEVGGTYKGIVTSIKEYGAFVELNGGQQGLLHVSELSHEPLLENIGNPFYDLSVSVSKNGWIVDIFIETCLPIWMCNCCNGSIKESLVARVSDVITEGQQLTVMCIGQDVRGNIKLSLKATSPRRALEPNNIVKQAVPIWPSVEDGPSSPEQDSKEESSSQSTESYESRAPSILIRSAAECEEEEKSAGLLETLKNSKSSKKLASSTEKRSQLKSTFRGEGDEETEKEAPTAKNLKLGMRVTAKVHKVLGRGLVLDLGNGVRGMYRFEGEGKADYEVGDPLRVVCTSFSSKGVPVMSLLEDD